MSLDHPPPWKHLEHLDSQGFTHNLDGWSSAHSPGFVKCRRLDHDYERTAADQRGDDQMGDDRIDGPTTRATTRPQAVAARLNRRLRLSQHSLSVSSRRSDPHPEILQLVENKTGTPDLVSSAISQCAQHAGIAKPADGVEHAAARCIDQLNGIVSRQNRYARQQREDLGGSAAASHWSGQFPPLAGIS